MPIDPVTTQAPALLARHAATLHAAARKEHHVVSALGAWLVLAVAGQAGVGESDGEDAGTRRAVERALGLPLADAGRVAVDLLGGLHPEVVAAVGVWWREQVATDRLTAYLGRLPASATRKPLTGLQQLDDWTRERTLGLIDRFPGQVTSDLMAVLASAVATKARWLAPFQVVPASELAVQERPGGFSDGVSRALRSASRHDVRLVRTQAAGLVGAHVAASSDGLAVVSVLGAPEVDRAAVITAAHEVALGLDRGRIGERVSLFDVPEGRSDLGEIVEETVTLTGGSVEEGHAVLPTWHASTQLELLDGPSADGFRAAGQLLADLLPPGGWRLEARQATLASYTRVGFEAAAVTLIRTPQSAPIPRQALRRTLTLRFNRPYAAVAVAVDLSPRRPVAAGRVDSTRTTAGFVLPVFSAWVAEPAETPPAAAPQDTPPTLRSRREPSTGSRPGST